MHIENYIHDGYTQSGYIKAEQGLHNELRFVFRPMLIEERSLLTGQRMQALPDPEQERRAAHLVLPKLLDWQLVDCNQRPVELTVPNLLRLRPALFRKLVGIVAGFAGTDADPHWSPEQDLEHGRDWFESCTTGAAQADLRAEHDEKN